MESNLLSPELIRTSDGSDSLYIVSLDEHYHSTFGAVQESIHVFINAGLLTFTSSPITIFEVGFGTGLNAWLTLLQSVRSGQKINYICIEKFPLSRELFETLNYPAFLGENPDIFLQMHQSPWNEKVQLTEQFNLYKISGDLINLNYSLLPQFDLVYFDAFSPEKQPELWEIDIFKKLFSQTSHNGKLVTYCAKGSVRRALKESGYITERIAGPPGKREMLRASKSS